jgi:hypothetical protein
MTELCLYPFCMLDSVRMTPRVSKCVGSSYSKKVIFFIELCIWTYYRKVGNVVAVCRLCHCGCDTSSSEHITNQSVENDY